MVRGFPPFRQKKSERMGHGISVFVGRIIIDPARKE
jgi:hypothetical protein